LEGAKGKWAMYLAGLPDLRVTIEELVAEGDKVAVRRSYAGTHRGELLGIPATGKQVRLGGISIFRLAGGRIAEQWEQLDRLALLQQLGVVPTPGQAPPQA
jgi:predicted ester cyclase